MKEKNIKKYIKKVDFLILYAIIVLKQKVWKQTKYMLLRKHIFFTIQLALNQKEC